MRFTKIPPLAQHLLPNLDIIVDCQTMLPRAKYSLGVLEVQKSYDWASEGQLHYMPASDRAILEVDFQMDKEEYWGLVFRFIYGRDYGVYCIFLDGKNIRELDESASGQRSIDVDFYSPQLRVMDNYLGSFKLPPGKHTLKFECLGQNPFARGNYLGLDSVHLNKRWNKKRQLLK